MKMITMDYLKGLFVNQKKKAREKRLKEQQKKDGDSSKSSQSKSSKTSKKSLSEVSRIEDKAIPGAITPDSVVCQYPTCEEEFVLNLENTALLGPRSNPRLNAGHRIRGILVNGPRFVPQFIPEDISKDEKGNYKWSFYDSGQLVKHYTGAGRFMPDSDRVIDLNGITEVDDAKIKTFKPIRLKVYDKWLEEKAKIEKREREKEEEEEFKEEQADKDKQELEDIKNEDRKVNRNRKIAYAVGSALVVSIVIIFVVLYLCGVFSGNNSPSAPSSLSQSNEIAGSLTSNSSSDTGKGPHSRTTTKPTTTTTKAYPAMTIIEPASIVNLSEPTFEIESTLIKLKIKSQPTFSFDTSEVTFSLKAIQPTKSVQLRYGVTSFGIIHVDDRRMKNVTHDKEAQLLTIHLPETINGSSFVLDVSFTPVAAAFDRIEVPCGSKECSVLIKRDLRLFIPHFDYPTRQKWSIEGTHPDDIKVLANMKTIQTTTHKPAPIYTEKPTSLYPNELSIVITNGFEERFHGKQTRSYSTNQTDGADDIELLGTLVEALELKNMSLTPYKEIFSIIVVPGTEKYQFFRRNVALVGSDLLMANQEILNEFVWRFIYRAIIYKKVSSNDKNPTWIYEQSAFFLSTMIKSNNKNMWKKHLYGSALDSGYRDIKGLSDQAMTYEDECRYLDKYEHIAKVSTVLAMVTSLGSSVSGDPLTILDEVRDNSTSDLFFFVNKQLKLQNGQMLNVDGMTTCYIDSPVTPRVHFSRVDPSHVLVQRTDGGEQSCDMYLYYVRDKNNKATTTKEYMLLSSKEQKVTVEAKSAILLSGDSPFSAYGYTMEQREFDRLVHEDVLASFDDSSLNMLAYNAFRAAFEGTLSYESLHSFMKMVVSRKVVSVDEAVDLWMWTVRQSRSDSLLGLPELLIASVLNSTGSASDSSKVEAYIQDRFDKSMQQFPSFEIEKAMLLLRSCGENCLKKIWGKYFGIDSCISQNACSYDPRALEVLVCAKMVVETATSYETYLNKFDTCFGRPCRMPILRGLMCTNDKENFDKWLSKIMTLEITDRVDRQVVVVLLKGMTTNSVAKPLLLPYFMDNWHLIHKKYSEYPVILGDMIEAVASTISTEEQLNLFKQFVAYYGQSLDMYREFKIQIFKAEKAVEWNKNHLKDFNRLFH